MYPAPLGRRCTVCGRHPIGTAEVSLHGEVTCTRHSIDGRCVFCSRPHVGARPPGWRSFAGTLLQCPMCLPGAVQTQDAARARLPAIRREMASIGVGLPIRVRVRVVDPESLGASVQQSTGGLLLGMTEKLLKPDGSLQVVEIRIARGQPPLHFGSSVTHEIGHAWLAQHGIRQPDSVIEEGFCQLLAHAWLKQQTAPQAAALRQNLRENPDPVYGEGFRIVRAAAVRHGVAAVMRALTLDGRLPA